MCSHVHVCVHIMHVCICVQLRRFVAAAWLHPPDRCSGLRLPVLQALALIGEFNNWSPRNEDWAVRNPFGTWELFIPDLPDGSSAIPHRCAPRCHRQRSAALGRLGWVLQQPSLRLELVQHRRRVACGWMPRCNGVRGAQLRD